MKSLFRQALGYGAASAAALAVDIAILWILVRYGGWHYLVAATVSYLVGAGLAYFLSLQWAFRQHRLQDRRLEFVAFLAIGAGGLAVNAGVMSLLAGFLGLHILLAKGVAAACSFFCNFVTRRQFLFYRRTSI